MRPFAAFGLVWLLAACAEGGLPSATMAGQGEPPGRLIRTAADRPILPEGYLADLVAADAAGAVDLLPLPGGRLYLLSPDGLSQVGFGARERILTNTGRGPWTALALQGGRVLIAEDGRQGRARLLRLDGATATTVYEALPSGRHAFTSPAIGPDGSIYVAQGSATNAGVGQAGVTDQPCQDLRFDGRRLRGAVPCHGAVLRLPPGGGVPQVVAWGLRDPAGLAVRADGAIFVAERSFEPEPARNLAEAQPDLFRKIVAGVWYGWPDHGATALGGPLVADPPNPPPAPLAQLAADAEPGLFAMADKGVFGGEGQAYVPLAGEGRVARIDPETGAVADFALGFGKPVAARFSPDGTGLYVLDQEAGRIWRIRRQLELAESR